MRAGPPSSPQQTPDQTEIVRALSTGAIYGRADVPVERLETHSAYVFLVADRAYKLKRAVRYDYLDFSTPELRHEACEAEVRINKRTAPQIYLGVRPVVRSPGGDLRLDGPGAPVDWLVEMVRFDQEALLDRLAGRGCLEIDLMRPLADAIARLHAVAEVRRDHGGLPGMTWVIDGNHEGFREQGTGILAPERCDLLDERARAALEAHAGLLEDRRAGGRVRWGHGDLHLRNICLIDGRPTLFDAVEFNAEIACGDVLYDLAFLIMDLGRRGLAGHASLVLNWYLAVTDEWDGLPLLPLFLSCRAAVRAKTSATAARLASDPGRIAELEKLSREYLDMALELLEPRPARIIAIGGRSGAGKSTLAARLAPTIGPLPGAIVVRSDLLRKRLLGAGPHDALGPDGYTPEVTGRVYGALVDLAAMTVRSGLPVIADAVFGEPAHRDALAGAARAAGVPFTGLWLEAPPEILERRVATRTHDASEATVAVLRQQLARPLRAPDWIEVDASGSADDVVDRAGRALGRRS